MRGWCLVLLPVAAHAVALKRPAGVFVAPGSGITSDGFQPMEQWRHQHEAALSQTARSSLTAYRRTLKANLHRHRVAMHVDKTKLSGPWLDLGNMAQLICGICINLSLVACMMLELSQAAGGITEDERLLVSDGSWHRNQRKSISIETSCYYTTMQDMPYGCQYARAYDQSYRNEFQRKAEKAALLEFYNLCGGDFWRNNDNWMPETDPCWDYWYGVTCNEHGYVIKLELPDNRVRGILPSTLGSLTSLIKLDLASTEPDYHLHPNDEMNRVEGVMPSMALCFQLEEIEVSGNIILRLPDDLYLNADTLRSLSASRNLLRNLPIYLSRFQKLHTLELDNNRIEDQ
eukprot:s2949_g8.t2